MSDLIQLDCIRLLALSPQSYYVIEPLLRIQYRAESLCRHSNDFHCSAKLLLFKMNKGPIKLLEI